MVFSRGCRVDRDRDRFLARIDAGALIDVEHGDAVISLRSTPWAARTMSAAFTVRSTMKAKSRSTGWNGDSSSTGLARVAFALGSGNTFEHDLEGDQRAIGVERFQRLGMQLAEMPEHVLRSDLDGAAAAGMQPGRPARARPATPASARRPRRARPAHRPWHRTHRRRRRARPVPARSRDALASAAAHAARPR